MTARRIRLGFLVAIGAALAACAADRPRDPLADSALLPSSGYRAAVRRPGVLAIATVLDERPRDESGPSQADRDLARPAVEVVREHVRREIERAGLFAEVVLGAGAGADFALEISLLEFRGQTAGDLARRTGSGEVDLRARVRRRADGALIAERRYPAEASEDRVLLADPDALELACAALQRAVGNLVVDLDRLDLAAPGGTSGGAP